MDHFCQQPRDMHRRMQEPSTLCDVDCWTSTYECIFGELVKFHLDSFLRVIKGLFKAAGDRAKQRATTGRSCFLTQFILIRKMHGFDISKRKFAFLYSRKTCITSLQALFLRSSTEVRKEATPPLSSSSANKRSKESRPRDSCIAFYCCIRWPITKRMQLGDLLIHMTARAGCLSNTRKSKARVNNHDGVEEVDQKNQQTDESGANKAYQDSVDSFRCTHSKYPIYLTFDNGVFCKMGTRFHTHLPFRTVTNPSNTARQPSLHTYRPCMHRQWYPICLLISKHLPVSGTGLCCQLTKVKALTCRRPTSKYLHVHPACVCAHANTFPRAYSSQHHNDVSIWLC
jgi:hypothetical protein